MLSALIVMNNGRHIHVAGTRQVGFAMEHEYVAFHAQLRADVEAAQLADSSMPRSITILDHSDVYTYRDGECRTVLEMK